MQFHARQQFLQLNLHWPPDRKKPDRSMNAAEADRGKGMAERTKRCFTRPHQIIELHLQYYHCRLTFLRAREITRERPSPCDTMRHQRPIPFTEKLQQRDSFSELELQVEAIKKHLWAFKKTPVTILRCQSHTKVTRIHLQRGLKLASHFTKVYRILHLFANKSTLLLCPCLGCKTTKLKRTALQSPSDYEQGVFFPFIDVFTSTAPRRAFEDVYLVALLVLLCKIAIPFLITVPKDDSITSENKASLWLFAMNPFIQGP